MAVGKPVVATEVGYVNFAIRHDVNGLLVPQGDTEGFAKALSRLALDSEMRNRLGKQGRLDAEAQHTWQTNVERILSRLPVKCF
jgi:glycosyltransferase involved in cell wall biosynthesis